MATPESHRAHTWLQAARLQLERQASRLLPRLLSLGAVACMLIIASGSPRARGDGGGDPAEALERLRQKTQQEAQQQDTEFQRLLEQGRSLLAQHAYDQAKRVLAQAARIRPDDETCARLLTQAEAATGTAPADKVLDRMREEEQFKDVSLRRQLDASLFDAGKALKDGEHARAREHAERILDGVACMRDSEEAAQLRARAEAILASANAAAEKAAHSELKTVLASAKERAIQDHAATVRGLMEDGWRRFDAKQFDKALAAAEEILGLDPGNTQALFLRSKVRRATASRDDVASIRAERKKATDTHLVGQVEKEMKVPEGMPAKIVLPGNRDPAKLGLLTERGLEPWQKGLRGKLAQPIEVEFQNTTLAEACAHLSKAAGCPIVVDPAVARDTRSFSLPKLTGMSLEHILRWVCRPSRAVYTLREHAILVTIRGGLLDRPMMKDYDVAGLLVPTRCVKLTFNGSSQVDDQGAQKDILGALRESPKDAEGKPVTDDVLGEGWVRFIRTSVAPESWEEPAKGDALQEAKQPYTINYRNGRIVVVHTPEVHEQIERLLNDFRKARSLQVHILARFILIDMDYLQSMDVDFGSDEVTINEPTAPPNPPVYGYVSQPTDPWQTGATPPRRSIIGSLITNNAGVTNIPGTVSDTTGAVSFAFSHLGNTAVNALVDGMLKRRKGSVLTSPRLTCFNTQRANLQSVTNFNYVRRVSADGEPEIGNVPEGIIFDVQPFVSADRRYITLVLQPQIRTLINRNFQAQSEGFDFSVSAAGTSLRAVNLPETELRSLATTVTVPDGGTLLVGGLTNANERSGESGVPFFNNVPLLRYIMREWGEVERRESLIILVTAEIVPDIFEE